MTKEHNDALALKLRNRTLAEARSLRDKLVIEMRMRLASCYFSYPYDLGPEQFGVSSKRAQTDFDYLFAFRAVPLQWRQPWKGYRVEVHGPAYALVTRYPHTDETHKRMHAITWKARQDGSWNFESMAADVGRAYRAESGHA
jgi:hypothetical protein